ncbi:UV-stimulated scaffold protein A-like [Dendronephthya gigantea]|uniref:UV-stimulated scaffold protein A-like n=1 Tax=Dendronephthya gigantea TaxID=151771 RepID=UPI00106D55E7|nr:UV-stimulated scaffold protein A-like [Dendronephthya gigantea]
MSNNDQDVLSELSNLIETLTTSGSRNLDEKLFKRVKSICKSSDENVKHLYRMIMTQLEKRHSEIRLSALQIINEIFLRSHAFRVLLVDDFQKFLGLAIGVNSKLPLPEPKAVAIILKKQAFQAIEKWHQKYGPHYVKLALGYKYLKRVKKFNFDDSQPLTEVERLRAQDVETRRANLAEQKLNDVLTQMSDSVNEIENVITEMGNCFRLVLPSPEEFDIHTGDTTNSGGQTSELSDSDIPSTSSGITHSSVNKIQCALSYDNLNDHGQISRSYQLDITLETSIEIIKTEDNMDVLGTLQELNKQVVDKYLPLTQKWLEVLTKHSGHHENLVQAIDLKNSLLELKYKFDKLRIISNKSLKDLGAQGNTDKCVESKNDGTAEDDFIDVPEKEGLEHVPESCWNEYGLEPAYASKPNKGGAHTTNAITWNPHGIQSNLGDPSSRATAIAVLLEKHEKKTGGKRKATQCISTSTITRPNGMENKNVTSEVGSPSSQKRDSDTNEKRTKLLKKAPVVPFGMDLYNWERKEDEAPSVSNLKSLHCYWTRPNDDNDDHCPGDIKESMKSRSIPFAGEFQQIKWACRAPLPSGKLCPRKDRFKCPFHGKIIPRDVMGRPEGEGDASVSDNPVQLRSSELDDVTRDIELATGMDLGSKKDKKGKKRKHTGLTDLKKNSNTSRARLEKIVLNKEALKRAAEESDRVKKSLIDEKFGNNWNYALKP